jgi:uncharacterized repeat protein (TIGR03803 family)
MSSTGGTNGIGTIYTVNESNVFTKVHDFYRFEGGAPKGEVVKASNGSYYGVTEFGGSAGVGVLFRYDPATSAYTVLKDFNSTASSASTAYGARPVRGILLAANGKIYGTCSEGGLNNFGTFWDYTIATNTLVKRVDFESAQTAAGKGRTPKGRLVQASNGLIFGTCQLGGLNGRGTIYQFNTGTNAFTKRYDFAAFPSVTGGTPFAGLVQASNGLLYGASSGGGTALGGVIYSFSPTTPFTYTVVHNFAQATGWQPLAELTQASNGLLYGVASSGGANAGGVLFSFAPTGSVYTVLRDMGGVSGATPYGRMIVGSNGDLYGATTAGGTGSAGVVFSYNISTATYTVLYNLSTGGFANMWSGMIEDPAGSLVGLCSDGGGASQGALFRLDINTAQATQLVPFSLSFGSNPKGRLLKASDGSFYGMTSGGGVNDDGVIFSFNPATNTYQKRQDLSATLGANPLGTFTEIGGKLYALCQFGGTNNGGTLIEYDLASGNVAKLKDLATAVGNAPFSGLFKAANGLLYGTTSTGAANGFGSLFAYTPGTNSLVKLHDLLETDGTQSLSDVMQASNGLLYGTSSTGGAFGFGSLWTYDITNSTFTRIYSFNQLQGAAPAGDILEATNGKLYGTFREDGEGFSGGIYSWTIGTATYADEFSFNIAPITSQPKLSEGNLIQGTNGLLYGTAPQGGATDQGIIFRYDPNSMVVTTVTDMDGALKGQYPFDGLARETLPTTNVLLSPKVFLEGPFVSATGKMNTTLRTVAGFPTTEPFTSAGFTIVGGGGETTNATVLSITGDNAVVDWILVELRDKNNSSSILRTKAALLQSDGDVVEVDGVSPLTFPLAPDNYFVAIRHRNHFGVMSATAVSLSGTAALLNFTSGAVSTFGTNAQKLVGGFLVNWAGNGLRDGTIKYTGASNDRDPILVRVGSTTPNNTVVGYFNEDVTLDGTVKYTGSTNDRDPILVNVGSTTPNNSFTEQLP